MIRLTAVFLLIWAPLFGQAQTEDTGVFARRIAAAIGSTPARLTVTERADSPTDGGRFGADLRAALQARRVEIDADAAAEIRVTLSSQSGAALWVAEIRQAGTARAIVFRPSEPAGEGETAPPAMALIAQPFYSQEEAILATFEGSGYLYVLSPASLTRYEGSAGQWTEKQKVVIPAAPSRDPRGRLEVGSDFVEVLRPGLRCRGSVSLADGLECRPFPAWPEGTNLAAPTEDPSLPRSYDSVRLGGNGTDFLALALVSGEIAIRSGPRDPWRKLDGYGSALTALDSSCSAGRLLLLSSNGDATERDYIQAVFPRGDPETAGAPLAMPGIVTELREAGTPGQAVAIVREGSTNRYVALHISALCGG